MIYVLPIEVPGYIIPFMTKECPGSVHVSEDGNFHTIDIEPHSILGMFLRRRIKADYKIRNYRMTIYTKKITDKVAYSTEILEFQNSAEYKVDLTFRELEDFYKFLDHWFRTSLFFYITGYQEFDKGPGSLKKGIDRFLDKYELYEYGYNYQQVRNLFYKYKENGAISYKVKNIPLSKLFF